MKNNKAVILIKPHVEDKMKCLYSLFDNTRYDISILFNRDIKFDYDQILEFYGEHKDKDFFIPLVNGIVDKNIHVAIIEFKKRLILADFDFDKTSSDIIVDKPYEDFRENVIGSTNCRGANIDTIRYNFGNHDEDAPLSENAIHCSDSSEAFNREAIIILKQMKMNILKENREIDFVINILNGEE